MIFSETIEGAVASLFFFDKAAQSKRMYVTEDNSCSYGHFGWYLALGVCLFLGLKMLFKRYFPGKKTSQTEIAQKKRHLSEHTSESNTTDPRHHADPFRSIQLPRAVRKLLLEDSQTRSVSTTGACNVHDSVTSPQRVKSPTAEFSKVSEPSTRYQDVMSSLGQSLKGQNSKRGSIKVSLKSPEENPDRQHIAKSPRSANAALQVAHSLVAQGDSKVSPQLPQKQRGQNLEVAQTQSTNGILAQDQVQDCKTRCVSDLHADMKLPLYLTDPNRASVTQKMRSMFSRWKLGKKWRPEQNSWDDVRFEYGTCCSTSGKPHLGQEIDTTWKATTSMDEKTCGNLEKESRHVHGISHREAHKLAARSGGKKNPAVHFGNAKRYSVGSLADVYTSLMCLNNTHKALTGAVMENEGFHDGGSPTRRKWKKGDKNRLETTDLSYKLCPNKTPIVFEIFPFEAFQKTAMGKIDTHCQINEAGLDNRRALKRNRRINVSKDGHSESVSVGILEIVATHMQPTDFKKSRSSKVRFGKRRKRICSDIKKDTLATKIKDNKSRVDQENDRCSSFVGRDVSVCVQRTVLQSTKENHKRHGLKGYDIRQTATELNLAQNEHGVYRDRHRHCRRELPQTSNANTKGKHKNRPAMLSLHDQRAESIRMVESLISVTGAQQTSSSLMLAAADRSVSHNLESRIGRSIALSMATAKTQQPIKPINMSALVETGVLKMTHEKENIQNKKAINKNLRFAVDTELYGASNPTSSVKQTSPATYRRSQKKAMPKSEDIGDGKMYVNPNKPRGKCSRTSNNYPKLFDKLVFENEDYFKNALGICQSTEPSICETMHREPQSPASMRVQISRSRTRPYTTLTSFLDHKEKEHNSMKDGKSTQAENEKGLAIKYKMSSDVQAAETNWARKDAIISQEGELEMMDCLNGSQLGTGIRVVETEGRLKDPVSGITCSHLTILSEQQQTQKQGAILGLHFGTDNLQLYSESVDSVSVPKKDNKPNKDVKDLLSRQNRTGSLPKQQTGMKYVPFSSTEHPHRLRRPIIEAKSTVAPTATEKTTVKRFRRNSFRVIKKDVIKKTNTRENNSMQKAASSVANKKPDLETAYHKNGHQCLKNNFPSSLAKLKSKTLSGVSQPLFAIPDPTRGSENVAETEYLKLDCRDSLNVPDVQMAATEHKTKLEHAPALDAPEQIDTFKDIISLEQPTLKSPMSGKPVLLLSPNKTCSVEFSSPNQTCSVDVSSPYRIHAGTSDSSAQLDTLVNGGKTLYPSNKTMISPDTEMPLILKAEQTKKLLDPLQADNTPPTIRKKIRRLKTCILGHVISKLSETDSKPPRSDAFKDTDLSSTSRSVTSTDINAIQTTKSTTTETKDQIPVIVTKLVIDPVKHRSDTLQRTPSSGKQNLSQEESVVTNLLPTSFSHSHQPLQSIRRGSLKDIFDRYVVHTSEFPQRNTVRIIGKCMRPTKKAESDAHLSLIDQDPSTRSPTVTSYQVKPAVLQRNISSYTSKYRANDNSDKSVKSSWRGTVAFRKRLQHLLQHNKHIQNKYKHINMATDKTSSVDLNDGKLNLSSARQDKVGSKYKVSRMLRPGLGVRGQISEKKQDTRLGTQEPVKANNVYSAHKVVTPVSKLLDVRDQTGIVHVDNRKKDTTEIPMKSPLQDKTRDEQNKVPSMTSPNTSPFTSTQKVTNYSKSIITHSDHFEEKIQYQLKRQSEAMEHKLNQMRASFEIKPLTSVTHIGTRTKSYIPSSASNRKVFSSRSRLTRLKTEQAKIKGTQQKTIHTVAAKSGKDVAGNEQAKSATQVVDSPYIITPGIHQPPHSEAKVAETVPAKLHNTVPVLGVEKNHSVLPSEIHAEVTRFDFFTPNEEQLVFAGDTRRKGTIKKEMAHVSETEQNLQMLLDKIKQRSCLTSPANNDKEKGNVDSPGGIVACPDINVNPVKQTKVHPKPDQNQQSTERLSQTIPAHEYPRDLKEQTKCNFTTDKKTVAGISEIVPANSGRTQKESTKCMKVGIEIKKMHEGNKKTDTHVATKTASNTEFTVKDIKHLMIMDNGNDKQESQDNIKTEETANAPALQVVNCKYRSMPRNKARRTSSLDKKPSAEIENCITSASNVKHVAFNLNDHIDKSNTESLGAIISEVETQKTSETCSAGWSKELSDDTTDKIHSHSSKTALFHNKVRQAMSVLNILSLDEVERADKNVPRKDIHADQISDTSHTYEKQQSSTEATAKLLCSSGYGTMDIVSTTSFSQLQNSSSVEPGQLTVEPVIDGEVCILGTYKDTDNDHHLLGHGCKEKDIPREISERVGQVSSLATSFWKKEIHMDVIPEEADCENGVDSHIDVESGKSKLTEFGMKKSEVEKVNLEYTASQEYVAQSIVPDKSAFETTNQTKVENINNEDNTVYLEKCEAGEKSEDYRLINPPIDTQNVAYNYMEISCDVVENHLETHLNQRNLVSDTGTTREVSLCNAEESVCNHRDIASENCPANNTCVPEQANEDFLSNPHLDKAATETISQLESTQAQLKKNIGAEDESCGCSLHPTSGYELLRGDVQNTALDCSPLINEKESQCEEINKVNTVMNCGSNVVLVKDSSSFTTEPTSERPDPSNHQTYSLMFAKTLENYRECSQSKSDSIAAKHEVGVCDFISTTELSKQSLFLGERNKSDLTTAPMKSTTYDVQGMKSFSSMAEQSYGSSDSSLSEGVFKCTDDLDATSHKPPHEEIDTLSIAKNVETYNKCSRTEDTDVKTDVKKAIKTIGTLVILGSSSQTRLPDSEDDDTFQKLSEPSTAKILAQGDNSTISQNKTAAQGDVQCRDKQTPDLNMHSLASNGSESTTDSCIWATPVPTTTLNHQPTAETQTTELDFYNGDVVRTQKSVGLQVGHAVDENTRSFTDNSGSSWNCDVLLKQMASPVSSTAEASKTENYRKEKIADTKSVIFSSSRKEKTEENDKSAVTVTLEQNINENKERSALKREITKEHRCVVRTSRQRAPLEGISQSVMDDLESLLNKELSHANADGGLRQASDINRLFGTYERNRRREKRRKQKEKTLSQSPSQRELQHHFLRENDGSVKRSSSNTSQRTVFSPNDTGIHHSSRAIRPLALGRVTKLEEFLQRAEEANRSETMSNISRAVSKLSSFTSVTLSSQEEQLTCQTRSGNDAPRHKQRVVETEGNIRHTASELNTMGSVSRKCSQLSRVKNLKGKICENEHQDSKCATCISANDQSHFPDGISDCTKNNDYFHVNDAGRSLSNMAGSNITEQKHVRTYSSQITTGGFSSHTEMTVASRAKDSVESRIVYVDTGSNTGVIKKETSVDIHTSDVAGCSNYANKQMFIEQPTANIATALATEECSTVSTSSSSIVLSWIGSDLGDTEELMQSQNCTDQEDKLYSDDVTEFNNYHTQTHQTNDTHQCPQAVGNTQQLYDECYLQGLFSADTSKLRRSTFSDSVSQSSPLTGSILHKSERRMPGCTVYDNNEKSRISYLGENVCHYKLTRIKQSKKMSPVLTSLPSIEYTLYDTHKKDDKQTSQARFSSSNYFKCPQKDKCICSPASPKMSKQPCSFWNNNPKECLLEQPSYFNALLRDPKWNPSFEIKEVRNKTGHPTEEPSAAGSYVQSAWTYQQVRHMSPSIFSPQKGQECSKSIHSHTTKQQSEALDKPGAHVVSSISTQRSNTNINFDIWSIHSNESDAHSHQYPTTKTSPRNAFTIQCPELHSTIQHDKENQKNNTNQILSQDFSMRGITKQNTFLRTVHFDSNFKPDKTGSVSFEATIKPVSQSRVPIYSANNKSTETRSLDQHLKTSTRSGAVPVKYRLSAEQQSQGSESTKTKTKMSLEQHLCSTFDTQRNSMSNAAQPSSEHGTTKSTSSHASLNWYKPQSLPSSTSESNGNTSNSHQETSNKQETDSQERACQTRTPHSEPGISPSKRRSTAESTRRQNTHTLEHSMINNQDRTPSLSGSTHVNTRAQKSANFCLGTHSKLLTPTLIPTVIPRAEKNSFESLLTPASTSTNSSKKHHIPVVCWLRNPGSSRATRHTLPQPPCGNNSGVYGCKPTRRLSNTSNQSKPGSKISGDCEVRASANQARGIHLNNRKSHTVSNSMSPHSLPVNSEKEPAANNNIRANKVCSNHVQSLRKSQCSSVCTASSRSLQPRTSVVDTPDTTMNGIQHRTKSSSTQLSNRCASESHHSVSADPVSPFKGAKRVSKLVEMFEKKLES